MPVSPPLDPYRAKPLTTPVHVPSRAVEIGNGPPSGGCNSAPTENPLRKFNPPPDMMVASRQANDLGSRSSSLRRLSQGWGEIYACLDLLHLVCAAWGMFATGAGLPRSST